MSASQRNVPQPNALSFTDSALRVFTGSAFVTAGEECDYEDWRGQYGNYNRTEFDNAPVPMHLRSLTTHLCNPNEAPRKNPPPRLPAGLAGVAQPGGGGPPHPSAEWKAPSPAVLAAARLGAKWC